MFQCLDRKIHPEIGRYISPFRYPGGKSWFLKIARRWLAGQVTRPEVLVEPFAGGSGISLTAIGDDLVDEVVFCELDQDVAAIWETILNGRARWLTQEILSFRLSRKRVEETLSRSPKNTHERAFRCLLRNRTARGGVLKKGAGLLRRGEEGRGLRSRWYPQTLAKRIETIVALKPFIQFRSGDGFALIREYLGHSGAVFFVDPPYTRAARRLYSHWDINHKELFQLLARASGNVLMTYDDTVEVRGWAEKYGFQVRRISMRTTHHCKKRELMISRQFDWLK
jgi:DNA adenine methylase